MERKNCKKNLTLKAENTMNPLINKQCRDYSKDESPLNLSDIENNRKHIPQWQFCATENVLCQTFHFKNYHETIAFVNTVAEVSHKQNHHPDMEVSYNRCKVSFRTHSVNGVTENDFICASDINEQINSKG